jgi:hypothetical protein
MVLEQIELSQALDCGGLAVLRDAWRTFQIGEAFCRCAPSRQRRLLQTIAPSNRSRRAVGPAGGPGGHRSGFDGRVTVPALWDKVPAPSAVVGVICVRVSMGLCIQLAFTERIAGTKVE